MTDPPFKVIRGHWKPTDRSATCDFLLTLHSIHGPISYRFRDERRFRWRVANFNANTEGVPLRNL